MKRRSITVFLLVGLIAAVAGLTVLRATNPPIVLTRVAGTQDTTSPIGIDWLSARRVTIRGT